MGIGLTIFRLRRKLDALERQHMARVTWNGETFTAKPISQNADGTWLMEAEQHTARTVPGTHITVQAKEIVAGSMDTTAQPANDGQAQLEAAMAEERKTLPDPAALIKQAQAANASITSQGDAGAVSGGPSQAPAAAQASTSNGTKSMTHLADKMKLLATGTQGFAKQLEDLIDQKLASHQAAQSTVISQVTEAFATVDAITADAQNGVVAIQAALKDLTNQ